MCMRWTEEEKIVETTIYHGWRMKMSNNEANDARNYYYVLKLKIRGKQW